MASTGSSSPSWAQQQPPAYSIVVCKFPERHSPGVPGPITRPCLVLAVYKNKDSGDIACRVAFGTKNLKITRRQDRDIIIQNATDISLFGLGCATRFDLDNLALLPWTEKYFSCWRGFSTPVLGSLTQPYIKDYAYKMMLRKGG